jgi:hypothetical protein
LTTSQHARPTAACAFGGRNFHFSGWPGVARSIAYDTFGYGVTRYIVLSTTNGWPSCPRSTPVENVHATRSRLAFAAVISASSLYREFA